MLLLNVTPQTQTTYVDIFNEQAGTKFICKVTAVDKAFNESAQASLWVQLPDVIPPSAPFLHETTYERNKVNLKWDAIVNDVILSYDVYRVYEGREEKINKEPIVSTNFIDSENTKKRVFQYYVKPEEIQAMKLFRKSDESGFVRVPFKMNQNLIIDETSEENKIYEYYFEVLTKEDVKFKTQNESINNTF